jgi:plasmid segregation protein ParM
MNTAIDIGYYRTKAIRSDAQPVSFPSITGTPDRSRFTLNGHNDAGIILTKPYHLLVGEQVEDQSLYTFRWEDRDWIRSDDYAALLYAALTELTTSFHLSVNLVTGLPVRFYEQDRDYLKLRLMATHRIHREGRQPQTIHINRIKVLPQNIGTYLAVALDDRGRQAVDTEFITREVGVIDIGSFTTNFSKMRKFTELNQESTSIQAGGWKLADQVRQQLDQHYPDMDLKDHQLMQAIITGQAPYYETAADISEIVNGAAANLETAIMREARRLWGRGASLHTILITGGGALLIGERIKRHFRHARLVEDPIFANVRGYWRLAQVPGVWDD